MMIFAQQGCQTPELQPSSDGEDRAGQGLSAPVQGVEGVACPLFPAKHFCLRVSGVAIGTLMETSEQVKWIQPI